jgi:4-hydroxybenzoate polyprenyltransferase
MAIYLTKKLLPVKGLLRITRSYNLLIIMVTQYFVYIFLVGDSLSSWKFSFQPTIFLLSISTVCIAAAGYIINDYHDVKIDMINKPGRVVIGNIINRRIALLLYLLLSIVGIGLGFLLSWKIGLVNIFAAGWLWLYSIYFKKIAFWGNFSIAMLTAMTIIIIYIWKPLAGGLPLLAYAWFAFIITLIREIIKDMEDMKGDKLYGCKTLPIIWGIAGTSKLIHVLNLIMIISVIAAFAFTSNLFLRFFAVVIILQTGYLSYLLRYTDTKKGFQRLGRYCKIIMLTGILAMLFFSF